MSSYPDTLLPYYPPPFRDIEHIIFSLWDRHLELEYDLNGSGIHMNQHLDVTAAVIDFWDEILSEINTYEIQQRRSNSSKNT